MQFKKRKTASLLLAFGCLVLVPDVSSASSCNREVVAPIRFKPGATCWTYAGKATHFTGRFAANQKVTVRMRGVIDEYDPKSKAIVSSWTGRQPAVQGPGGFRAEAPGSDDKGELAVVLPAAGQYRFGFYPCAMWHQQGEVEICASPQ